MKLADIAERLGCRLEGDGAVEIVRVTGLQQAQSGDLAFFANIKYIDQLAATKASAVIVGDGTVQAAPTGPCRPVFAESLRRVRARPELFQSRRTAT